MNIGILTYHYSQNYGAVLQCYALKHCLEVLGHTCAVINYEDENQFNNASMYKHRHGMKRLIANAAFLPFHRVRRRKNRRFQAFRERNLTLTPRVMDQEQLERIIRVQRFDAIIVGSDQVWNPNIRDFTPMYFLPFHIACKKIGYAISLGAASNAQLDEYAPWIRDFDRISVREANRIDVIRKYIEKDVDVVPDPVFLLRKTEWEYLATKAQCNLPKNRYLLCYFIDKHRIRDAMKVVNQIAKLKNLEVISINASFSAESLKKRTKLDAGPLEFLQFILNASFVCTDSFHGTAFSLLLDKDFLSFDAHRSSMDSRKRELLKTVGMIDRLVQLEGGEIRVEKYEQKQVELKEHVRQMRETGMEYIKKYVCKGTQVV